MKELKSIISSLSVLLVVIFCAFTLVISGCGGGGDTSTQTTSVTDPTTEGGEGIDNPYAGSSQILGQVSLSSLINTDQTAIDESSGSNLSRRRGRVSRYIVNPTTEAVRLYVIGEDGELEDTNIDCTCQADPDDPNNGIVYTCPNVKDEINYIVKYIKLLGENKAIEMKANVYVEEGQTETVDITAQSSTIAESLKTAIWDATMGTGITQEIVNKIITAVEEVIKTLVESGAIQIPSMMADTEGATIAEVFGEDIENDKLNSTSGTVVSDESVGTQLDVVKTEIQSEQFDLSDADTNDEKTLLIERVFKEMMDDDDDGGAPDFMKDFFTNKFIADTEVIIGDLVDAISAGLHFCVQPPESLDLTKSGAINAFKTELINLYNLLDNKADETITDSELKEFAEYPPVILGLFPIAERNIWSVLETNTKLNVPQAIAFTIYATDVYISDAYEEAEPEDINAYIGDGGVVEYDKDDPFDFDPMAQGSIMDMLGFFEVATDYSSGIDILELWIHPGVCWIDDQNDGGQEVDMLNAGTCWMDMATILAQKADENMDGNSVTVPDFSQFSVTLTYPKRAGGTGTVALLPESDLHQSEDENMEPDPWDNCWVLDPWMEANQDNEGSDEWIQPNPNRIVSDFASGTYTITVTDLEGVIYSKEFNKKVITGMTDIYPTLISPAPMPIWPGHDATQEEMEEFETENQDYIITNFNANVDTNDDEIEDAAKVTISWKAPQLEEGVLPEGVVMGYELDVGTGNCDPDPNVGCYWEHVFATWEHDKILFGTSFTLPVPIPQQEVGAQPYQVHMHVIFIDQATGQHLGQGGQAHGEFRVAIPLVLTDTFTITGPVTIKNMEGNTLTLDDVQNLKAVLFRETYDDTNSINSWNRTVLKTSALTNDGNCVVYTLVPEIGDFLNPDVDAGGWVGIDIFHDIDDDDQIDDSLDTEPWHEPQWGPQWDADVNVWFETWGGILRVKRETSTSSWPQETIITGGEEVDGPVFEVDIWYNPNIPANNY